MSISFEPQRDFDNILFKKSFVTLTKMGNAKLAVTYNMNNIYTIYYSHFAKDHLYFYKKNQNVRKDIIFSFRTILGEYASFPNRPMCVCVQSTIKPRACFSTCTPLSKTKLG